MIDVVRDVRAFPISGTKGNGNRQTPHTHSTDSGNHGPALQFLSFESRKRIGNNRNVTILIQVIASDRTKNLVLF